MTTTRSFPAGQFALTIDGHQSTAYVKSIDGGFARAQIADDPAGGDVKRVKHIATVEVEPVSVEMGMTGAGEVLSWIQGSWNKQWSRRNGEITHANFDLYETYRHEFFDALITEASFPALDATSKDGGFLKFKFQPETIKTKRMPGGEAGSGGPKVQGRIGTQVRQKLWSPSAFRFTVHGIDEMAKVSKVESFTITQTVKKLYTGADRFPQIEPTGIKFPNIIGTIPLQFASSLLEWHEEYIRSGTKDHPSQKSGSIDFLSTDRKSTLFSIHLHEIGILFAGIESSSAGSDQIKRVKFELFVHRMELDIPGAAGFE
ncbi:MAG: phage tail protein [Kofleriaceae bacterium]